MLKKRVIACLIIKNGIVVQSLGFKRYLPIGDPGICVEFLNKWGIDEIVLLDIDATKENRHPNFDLITEISKKGFVPLTVGGGIKDLNDIRKLVHCGTDKISINNTFLENPNIVKSASEIFGNQCIVVSMDLKKSEDGKYEVFHGKEKNTHLDPIEMAKKAETLGAGEIFLNLIDRDGAKNGFDIMIAEKIALAVSLPVVVCGGAGHVKHFLEVFEKTKVSGAVAGNFFQFTEHSPILVKSYLKKNNIDVRLDTYANYLKADFSEEGRLLKMSDEYLDKLRFEYQKEEKI
jgi:cyclase